MNIPLYRAKRIDFDEYVEGYYLPKYMQVYDESGVITRFEFMENVIQKGGTYFRIDPSTLSISFPAMIDSEGTRIFASLREDGKGGDICNLRKSLMHSFVDEGTACYFDGCFVVRPNQGFVGNYVNLEVIGIQE